jgi:hypothetical protein
MLIGCEHSGTVREEMRKAGIDAWSCDLLPADDGSPYHIQGDVRQAMRSRAWDAFGLHPDCTFLTVAGIHWNNRGRGWEKTEAALEFVREIVAVCSDRPYYLENPVCILSTKWRKPTQSIQPNQFGHDASKKTCLWLQGFSRIAIDPAQYVKPRYCCPKCKGVFDHETVSFFAGPRVAFGTCPKCSAKLRPRWSNQTDSGQNKLPPSPDRWKLRSKTYPGIARAMASTWAPFLLR